MKNIIEASILSADFSRLGDAAREAEDAGVDAIQVDVMDGVFVPPITFGSGVVSALRSLVSLPLDVHLMIVEPERHLAAFVEAGADRLVVHQEACVHLYRVLGTIRKLGVEAGVALNPATPLSAVEEVVDVADMIQVMTVNPGWGGQPFLQSQLSKITRLKEMLEERDLQATIAVDGGIDATTAPLVVEAVASVLVAGSSLYNDRASLAENLKNIRSSIAGDI
jgi:ribulose-phosphate 3-epimerase